MKQTTIPDNLASFLENILNSQAGTKSISGSQRDALRTLAARPEPAARMNVVAATAIAMDGDSADCDIAPEIPILDIDLGTSTDVDTDQTVDSNWPPLGSGDSSSPPAGDSGTTDSGSSDGGGGDSGGGGGDSYWWGW